MSSVSRKSIFYPLDSTWELKWDEIVELDCVFQFKDSVTQNFRTSYAGNALQSSTQTI